MIELTAAENEHILRFQRARPGWPICVLTERIHDEDDGNREHKYGKVHPYVVGMHYVMTHLSTLPPSLVLDVGSPFQQNVAVAFLPGIDLTVLDVRPNESAEQMGVKWKVGTATAIPFQDGTFDVVTCMWVMGHVGDGRYGDDLSVSGDLKMLAELSRVLKIGGTAIIGPGLVDETPSYVFNLHRIYSWLWLSGAFENAGLELIESQDIPVENDLFFKGGELKRADGNYALARLRKR